MVSKPFGIVYRNNEVRIPGRALRYHCEPCGWIYDDELADTFLRKKDREAWNLSNRTTHELKCWSEPFQAVVDGKKTHEIRKDDRGFEVHDVLHLREFEHCTGCHAGLLDEGLRENGISPGYPCCGGKKGEYTGREVWAVVTYITRDTLWGLTEGTVVLSIRCY